MISKPRCPQYGGYDTRLVIDSLRVRIPSKVWTYLREKKSDSRLKLIPVSKGKQRTSSVLRWDHQEQMMDNVEFETVTTIVAGLKPLKIGLEKLSCPNATLLTAESVFPFIIGEMNEPNS
ncbi:hypothetical protein TNCV_3660651 [Trichonephila clavipes]|nr:hypothetical protein TNCV_3660651 [Trichonephila clavipes]